MKTTILTHEGIFHADEVFATAVAMLAYPEANVYRVRDIGEYSPEPGECLIVIDIGGVYSPAEYRFDHHQGGIDPRSNGVPYASFGLILQSKIADRAAAIVGDITDEDEIQFILDKLDSSLGESIDAWDTGWEPRLLVESNGECPTWRWADNATKTVRWDQGLVNPRPPVATPMSVSQIISAFNPTWDDATDRDIAFMEAVAFAKGILTRSIKRTRAGFWAKEAVMYAPTWGDGKVLFLKKFVPWQEHLTSRADYAALLYVIFPSLRGGWVVQQVPAAPYCREGRKPLPEAWAGLRNKELANVTGVWDATFCHQSRFMATAETLQGAFDLANKAIES